MNDDPIARRVWECDQRSDEIVAHVRCCADCDPSQEKDSNWQTGLCPAARLMADRWRSAESGFLEEVFKLDFDGSAGR